MMIKMYCGKIYFFRYENKKNKKTFFRRYLCFTLSAVQPLFPYKYMRYRDHKY